MKAREIVYMVLDRLKGTSDDFTYTEDHILFMMKHYRTLLFKQLYKDGKNVISSSNYQDILVCLETEDSNINCMPGYLKSKTSLPSIVEGFDVNVYPADYYAGTNIIYTSMDRMRYIGNNRYMQNLIYCSLNPDKYLYFKSSNPQYKYLEKVYVHAIFEDWEKAHELSCSQENKVCNIMDAEFPMESILVTQMCDNIFTVLSNSIYKPADSDNDANDDLAALASFLRTNMKSALQKQIES